MSSSRQLTLLLALSFSACNISSWHLEVLGLISLFHICTLIPATRTYLIHWPCSTNDDKATSESTMNQMRIKYHQATYKGGYHYSLVAQIKLMTTCSRYMRIYEYFYRFAWTLLPSQSSGYSFKNWAIIWWSVSKSILFHFLLLSYHIIIMPEWGLLVKQEKANSLSKTFPTTSLWHKIMLIKRSNIWPFDAFVSFGATYCDLYKLLFVCAGLPHVLPLSNWQRDVR